MSENERLALLEKDLAKYGTSLDPEDVAEALGCTRRYVDKLLDESKIEYYVLDPTKQRQEKRVLKATIIAYMLNKQN